MDILEKIVAKRLERIAAAKALMPEARLERTATAPCKMFSIDMPFVLISECKKASPSKGILLEDYRPLEIAFQYERGGATAISCLTEPDFFMGDEAHLRTVRAGVNIPVLRKDFIVDPYQIKEAWAMGADAILLIASILSKKQIKDFADIAHGFGLQSLLEIHGEDELDKTELAPVDAVGVNARNLRDFSTDLDAAAKLCEKLPDNVVRIAESGIDSPSSARSMCDAGYRGFLIGEHFMKSADRVSAVAGIANELRAASGI